MEEPCSYSHRYEGSHFQRKLTRIATPKSFIQFSNMFFSTHNITIHLFSWLSGSQ